MSDAGNPTYPVKTIAALLHLTERRVQQLSKEGVIPRSERGRYELAPSIQGYIAYLQQRAAPRATDEDPDRIDYHVEKARKTRAEADIVEMEAAKMRRELVSVAEMTEAMGLVVSEVRSRLLNQVPVRIASKTKTLRKEAAIKKIAKAEITACLDALSKADPQAVLGEVD